jgi:cytochrome b subunit of formate dehydrogenase
VVNTSSESFKLANVNSCGNCHKERLGTYADTYHGQVNRLGYAYTAKCADCHGSHDILPADNPKSKVHPSNRMETCATCHSRKKPGMHDAPAGFASFAPHAHGGDFAKYPQMWIATKFMTALLIFVFAFFWAHSLLWYWREWQDRKAGKAHPHIDISALGIDPNKHFQRFALGWRVGHLLFALATMTLVITGTTALFAESRWAPTVAALLGGPKVLAIAHRVAAAIFVAVFLVHFVYVMQKLLRDRSFRWFGPDSFLPNWKDFSDCWGMFKWFLGKGPRPQFERWAYYEKFDYWAVFWGVNVIGWSGLMLAFPHVVGQYLPGWVFNVATLVHGEEAFLAAVFLFTVHFFNNHFRPDKLPPPDVVMFTGTQSLEEFRADHPAHFQRMLDSGELHQHLVDKPSRPMHLGSVMLGLTLITMGLVLLVLVIVGFVTT